MRYSPRFPRTSAFFMQSHKSITYYYFQIQLQLILPFLQTSVSLDTFIFSSTVSDKKDSRTTRTLLLVLSQEHQNLLITPVLKYLDWLKVNERQFSQQTNLNISTTWFLFSLVVTHVLHPRSLLLVHLPGPLWKSLIALFSILHLVYGTNSQWSSPASSDTVSFTFTYHTWQFINIFFTIFTITTCIFSYSFSLSLLT